MKHKELLELNKKDEENKNLVKAQKVKYINIQAITPKSKTNNEMIIDNEINFSSDKNCSCNCIIF